jgi:hypothetical protein
LRFPVSETAGQTRCSPWDAKRRMSGFNIWAPGLRSPEEIRKPSAWFVFYGGSSHLWLDPTALNHNCLRKLRPHSREAGNLLLWDCKVTPAGCACQEGNTICCISSNDGLDSGLGMCFPHWFPTPVPWMKVYGGESVRVSLEQSGDGGNGKES